MKLYYIWFFSLYTFYCFSLLFFKKNGMIFIRFSSPEPKAQVSFSDQNLSVVRRRRRRCRRCRRCCRKLFTFSSSSPDPLGQFQPNLAQSILWWRGFKFVQMKGPAFFKGIYIYEVAKIHSRNKKIFFSRVTEPISTKLVTMHLWMMRTQVCSNEGPHLLSRGDNKEIAKILWQT